jgi:Alpha/beta hydrolase of unknown function (DUF900)
MSGLIKIFAFNTNPNISESIQVNKFKAFYLRSTANSVVERSDDESEKDLKDLKYLTDSFVDHQQPSEQIRKIVANIIEQTNGDLRKVNIILKIHGYNTSEKDFCENCLNTAIKIEEDIFDNSDQILLFFGYRWPSEPISPNRLLSTLSRFILPLWLQILGGIGVFRLLIDLFNYVSAKRFNWSQCLDWQYHIQRLEWNNFSDWNVMELLPIPILFVFRIATICVPFIITLMGLRGSEYFQDSYRAINHGVPDLVQFFRVFDYCIKTNSRIAEINTIENNRINLSFIAHSMGAFITTNLIRILSDVFDNKNDSNTLSVIDEDNLSYATGSPDIGGFFTLNRLILVAPDIPVNTVLLERSNYLGSSLVRFRESYLFSNRADMVLLLFSTVANYLSFPSCSPKRGYRLGNLGVGHYRTNPRKWQQIITRLKTLASIFSLKEKALNNSKYKIEEFSQISILKGDKNDESSVLNYLVVGVDNENLWDKETSKQNIQQQPYLAQKFTYFDCTDYLRRKILSIKGNFEVIDLIDYTLLSLKLPFTHNGYFDNKECPETHDAIYSIACQGFNQFSHTDNGKKILRGDCEIKVLRPAETEYNI